MYNLSVIQRSLLNVSCQNISYSYYIHRLACTSESAMSAPFHWISMKFSYIECVSFVPFLTCIYTIDISRPVKFSKSSIAHYVTKYFLLPVSTKELLLLDRLSLWRNPSMMCPKCFGNDATKFQQVHSNKRELLFFFSLFCKTLISETFGAKICIYFYDQPQNFPLQFFSLLLVIWSFSEIGFFYLQVTCLQCNCPRFLLIFMILYSTSYCW